MNDQVRLIEGIRRANQAGNAEAVRALGMQLRSMQRGAPQPDPMAAERSEMSIWDLNRSITPEQRAARATGQPRHAEDVAAGLDPASRERLLEAGQDATVELAVQAAAPGVGGAIAKPLGSLGRFLARGARGKAEVARELAAAGGSVKGKGSLLGDISKELGIAAGFGAVVDMGPGFIPGGQSVPEPLQDFAAFLATMSRLRPASRNLLLSHPKFAQWAQSSAKGGIGAAVGAMAGAGATLGPEIKAAIDEFMAEADTPGPQAGATDISGPLPPRVPQPMSRALQEQQMIARRLMA